MRDIKDNVVIVCSIENFDPMGIHTGDSITVAPAQTLTDKEYQIMRNAAIDIIREIGVETGGSNIQFSINPENGEMVIIEMNPRVSRSSALASKATGFPIAKIAAKLAVGYTLDEIRNDITRVTPVSFEPTLDYCVVKIPRFTFEKFFKTPPLLTTQMKSVGEVMSIGRTFKEALQKSLRSLEIGISGLEENFESGGELQHENESDLNKLREMLALPHWDRLWHIAAGLRRGLSIEEIYKITAVDPWFLFNLKEIVDVEKEIIHTGISGQIIGRRPAQSQANGLLRSVSRQTFELRRNRGERKKDNLRTSSPYSNGWTPAARNLKHILLICIPLTKKSAKPNHRTRKK